MTRRAEVCFVDDGWQVDLYPHDWPHQSERPIRRRSFGVDWIGPFPTHHEALTHALAATGLLRDGNPHTPCGRGPCALGDQHQGACRC